MDQVFEIREKPQFKLILTEDLFKIHNKGYPNDSKRFAYSEIEDMKIIPREINWGITLVSYITSFFGAPAGQTFRKKSKLRITKVDEKNEEDILLIDCDLEIVENAIKQVKSKIGVKTYT